MNFTSDMQVTKGRVLRVVFTASLLALVSLAAIAPANAESSAVPDSFGNSASIKGSWLFNINITVNQQPVAAFKSLISFAAGGVVVTTASSAPASTFYGDWKCKKSDSFSAVFYAFAPDSSGNIVGLQRTSVRLHLEGPNNLVGTGEGAMCDLQGENCVDEPGVFQSTGKRLGPGTE